MSDDFNVSQTQLTLWSLVLGFTGAILCYLVYGKWVAYGTIFGLFLMLFNWLALDKILFIAFNVSSPQVKKMISFLLYHVRFILVVLIMFLVIPKTNLYFGIGTFFGFAIPKMVLGVIIYQNQSDDWWLHLVPKAPPSVSKEEQSTMDRERLSKDPFEIDPVEVKILEYFKRFKGE